MKEKLRENEWMNDELICQSDEVIGRFIDKWWIDGSISQFMMNNYVNEWMNDEILNQLMHK